MRSRLGKRGIVVAALAAAASVAGGPALAYVLVLSNGATRDVTPDTLTTVTSPAAAPTSATTLTVSWTAPGTQVTGAQYRVVRTTDSLSVCTVSTTSCNDTNAVVPGTTYQYSVQTILSGTNWVSGTQTVSATAPDALVVTADANGTAIPSQTAGTAFNVTIRAMKGSPLTLDTANNKTVSLSGPATIGSNAPTYNGGAAVTLSSGQKTILVSLYAAGSTVINATANPFDAGASNAFTVAAGATTLVFSSSTVACNNNALIHIANNSTWTSKVSFQDQYGNLIPNAGPGAKTATVTQSGTHVGTLTPTSPSLSVAVANSESTNSFDFKRNNDGDTTVGQTITATSGTLTATCRISK